MIHSKLSFSPYPTKVLDLQPVLNVLKAMSHAETFQLKSSPKLPKVSLTGEQPKLKQSIYYNFSG